MSFYPSTATPPIGFQTDQVILRPLRAADNPLDYAAVMDSQAYLRAGTADDWPRPDFTMAENLLDLQRHEAEHEARTSFTFTVMNCAQTECLGCVYINPLDSLLEQYKPLSSNSYPFPSGCASVEFWMCPRCQAEQLDSHLLNRLILWFDSEWDLPQVVFTANRLETHQRWLYERAGLHPLLILDTANQLTIYGD